MTQFERLKIKIPEEADEAVLEDVLESAKNIILSRRFPFGRYPIKTVVDEYGDEIQTTYLEPRYLELQLQIAVALYNKIGADFEVGHSENGVSRSWGSESVPLELLSQIIPRAEVL